MAQLVYSLVPNRCVNCQAVTFVVGEECMDGSVLPVIKHINRLCFMDSMFVRGR